MAVPVGNQQKEQPPITNEQDEEPSSNGEEDDESEIEHDEDEEEGERETASSRRGTRRFDREKMENLFQRISTERVPLRVHDVIIKGNAKTKDWLIESEVENLLKNAATLQDLLQAASIANARLQRLDVFDSVNITLDAGPPELPGTSNVIVEVVETRNPLTGDIGIFSKPEVVTCMSVYADLLINDPLLFRVNE